MPTHDKEDTFWADWKQLTPEQRRYFQIKVTELTRKIKQGIITPTELGLKKYRGQAGIWEFRFGGNSRALLRLGNEVELGELHIIWLRIGTHTIYNNPEKK